MNVIYLRSVVHLIMIVMFPASLPRTSQIVRTQTRGHKGRHRNHREGGNEVRNRSRKKCNVFRGMLFPRISFHSIRARLAAFAISAFGESRYAHSFYVIVAEDNTSAVRGDVCLESLTSIGSWRDALKFR